MEQTRDAEKGQQKDNPAQAIESGDPQITGHAKGTGDPDQANKGKALGNRPKDSATDAPESGRIDALPN